MSRPIEIAKGVSVFIFGTMLFYFAWDIIISNMLNWMTSINTGLGVIGWVLFIAIYLFSCPIYLIYCAVSSDSGNKTDALAMLQAMGVWLGTSISITVLWMIFLHPTYGVVNWIVDNGQISGSMIDGAGNTVNWSNADTLTSIDRIGGFMVLCGMFLITASPIYWILKGYGIVKNIEEVKQAIGTSN